MNRYEERGIYGIDPNGAEQQRAVCPKCDKRKGGTSSKDLSVNVVEETWQCHSGNCDFTGSLKTKKEPHKIITKTYIKPPEKFYEEFLTKRKISKEVIDRNKVTFEKHFIVDEKAEVMCTCFNYYFGEDLVNVKYRSRNKSFQQEKDAMKIFYKINDIIGEKSCIITEGEIDALSFEVAGFKNAISIPDGAPSPNTKEFNNKFAYIDNCIEYFKNIEKIYLAADNDAPGIRLSQELAKRLGQHKCYIVKYPDGSKDANEVLVNHDKDWLITCIDNAEPCKIDGISCINDYSDYLKDIYDNGFPNGAKLGYPIFDSIFTWYPKELSVVTGIPSSGKSTWLNQVIIKLCTQNNWKFGVFSSEAEVPVNSITLTQQLLGKSYHRYQTNRMTNDERIDALNYLNANIIFIEPVNQINTVDALLRYTDFLILRYRINCLIIDPFGTLLHEYNGDTETIYIGKFLRRIKAYAIANNIHIILIAHPRKINKVIGKDKFDVPTLYDIAGSNNFSNYTDNGFVVYREFANGKLSEVTEIHIKKVRNQHTGRQSNIVKFNYEYISQRYTEIPDQIITHNQKTNDNEIDENDSF